MLKKCMIIFCLLAPSIGFGASMATLITSSQNNIALPLVEYNRIIFGSVICLFAMTAWVVFILSNAVEIKVHKFKIIPEKEEDDKPIEGTERSS